MTFGAQSRRPRTRCLRFATILTDGPRKTRFRLAVLCLGRWDSHPWVAIESFSLLHLRSLSPSFSWRNRKVIAKIVAEIRGDPPSRFGVFGWHGSGQDEQTSHHLHAGNRRHWSPRISETTFRVNQAASHDINIDRHHIHTGLQPQIYPRQNVLTCVEGRCVVMGKLARQRNAAMGRK